MKSLNCGVVGFIGEFNNLEFKKNDAEVERIFTVPIEVLIDQTVFRKTYFRNSSEFSFEEPLENSTHGFQKKFNFRSRHNHKCKKTIKNFFQKISMDYAKKFNSPKILNFELPHFKHHSILHVISHHLIYFGTHKDLAITKRRHHGIIRFQST